MTKHSPSGSQVNADPSAARTAYVTAIFAAAIVITVLALTAYFGSVASDENTAKIVTPESESLEAVRAEQRAKLTDYRWVSADSGVVAVPIERAMELVAKDFANRAAPAPQAAGN